MEIAVNKHADTSDPLFDKLGQICKMPVELNTTVGQLKAQIASKMEDEVDPKTIWLRNPKNDDLGEVLSDDGAKLESMYLFDEKEFYV